jgi:hypothetical protein
MPAAFANVGQTVAMPEDADYSQRWQSGGGSQLPDSRILTFVVEEDYVMVECLPGSLSKFESVLSSNPPVLESFLLQVPTKTIFQLYHTSAYLRRFLRTYPTAWRYLSFRLSQPTALQPTTVPHNDPNSNTLARLSPNYGVDQLLINIVNPFSTNLTSLELDNTAVSGSILLSTVLNRRRETLEHLSVRGCKNVSLKYHIVDWLKGFWTASDPYAPLSASLHPPQEFKNLALKSLYTYRCRHHRRRPYLPSSLYRRDSDSEPTHDVVNLCYKLGIWTDTAWCTTPGARCYRRRGYVTMRVPQDPREVWVVYDRLWRSKNWVGSIEEVEGRSIGAGTTRPRDGRSWEQNEEASLGEALGTGDRGQTYGEGKFLPMHLRKSHREFVESVKCHSCSADILERCEQCSVLMHCVGCRKTLCASCAFDRPYLRNRRLLESEEDKHDKFWWAPGCIVSPCSMQDHDDIAIGPGLNPPPTNGSLTPTLKFKWCCTEPVFSGGGGITFGPGVVTRDVERVRASPLSRGYGWEDPEFQTLSTDKGPTLIAQNRIPEPRTALGKIQPQEALAELLGTNRQPSQVPRNLCDECYNSRDWKVHCTSCAVPLCLEHDFRGLRMRVCGFKDLRSERDNLRLGLKMKNLRMKWMGDEFGRTPDEATARAETSRLLHAVTAVVEQRRMDRQIEGSTGIARLPLHQPIAGNSEVPLPISYRHQDRPITPDSNATATPSRDSSPAPSAGSDITAEETTKDTHAALGTLNAHPKWEGCYSFLCPQYRAVGDHRRRCTAVTKDCLGCKTVVCGQCLEGIEKACTCKGCSPNETSTAPSTDLDNTQFWCPNCRWEREQDGRCTKRLKVEKQRALEKGKGRLMESKLETEVQDPQDHDVDFNSSAAPEITQDLPEQAEKILNLTEAVLAPVQPSRVMTLQELVATVRRTPVVEDVD